MGIITLLLVGLSSSLIATPQISVVLHQGVKYDLGETKQGVRRKLSPGDVAIYSNDLSNQGGVVIVEVDKFCTEAADLVAVDELFEKSFSDVIFVVPLAKDFTDCTKKVFYHIEHKIITKSNSGSVSLLMEQQNKFLKLVRENKLILTTVPTSTLNTPLEYLPSWSTMIKAGKTSDIIISNSFDKITAFPSWHRSGLGGGTGLIALLEIRRVFSNLFKKSSELGIEPNANIIFHTEGGGRSSYPGLKSLINERSKTKNEIKFALCIEDLISVTPNQSDLIIHRNGGGGIDNYFSKKLISLSSKFSTVVKRQSYSLSEVELPHGHFSHHKIPSVSITRYAKPKPHLERYNEINNQTDEEIAKQLELSIKAMIESLMYILFDDINDQQVAVLKPLLTPSIAHIKSSVGFQSVDDFDSYLSSSFQRSNILKSKSTATIFPSVPVEAELYFSVSTYFDVIFTSLVVVFLFIIYKCSGVN